LIEIATAKNTQSDKVKLNEEKLSGSGLEADPENLNSSFKGFGGLEFAEHFA